MTPQSRSTILDGFHEPVVIPDGRIGRDNYSTVDSRWVPGASCDSRCSNSRWTQEPVVIPEARTVDGSQEPVVIPDGNVHEHTEERLLRHRHCPPKGSQAARTFDRRTVVAYSLQ